MAYHDGEVEAASLPAATSDARGKLARARVDGAVARRLSTGGVVVDLGLDATPAEVVAVTAVYRADPAVAYVEPDVVVRRFVTPNDELFHRAVAPVRGSGRINVDEAWAVATGIGVRVAVIDSGIVAHTDLAGQTIAGYDFVSNPVRRRRRRPRQQPR